MSKVFIALDRNLDINIRRAAFEACSARWKLGTNSKFGVGPRKITTNLNKTVQTQQAK